jgi:hypothetical protein
MVDHGMPRERCSRSSAPEQWPRVRFCDSGDGAGEAKEERSRARRIGASAAACGPAFSRHSISRFLECEVEL